MVRKRKVLVLVIVAKEFLKLPNLYMLIKQESLTLSRNLALGTFSKLIIVFSTKEICNASSIQRPGGAVFYI